LWINCPYSTRSHARLQLNPEPNDHVVTRRLDGYITAADCRKQKQLFWSMSLLCGYSWNIVHNRQQCLRINASYNKHGNYNFTFLYRPNSFFPWVLWRCWLGGRKGIRPVKNWMLAGACWHDYLTGARCRFAYAPADATATHCLLLQ